MDIPIGKVPGFVEKILKNFDGILAYKGK